MNIRKSYRITATLALLFAGNMAFAQNPSTMDQPATTSPYGGQVDSGWKTSLVRDGVYDRVPHINSVLPWQRVREVDVLWSKRVWREIDTREKQNIGFRYAGDENTGGGYFIEILIDAIKRGKVKAYGSVDDRFTTPLTKEQLNEQMSVKPDTTTVINPVDGTESVVITNRQFDPESVIKFRIKEDWIFDRNLGKMVVRIIGLAPMKDKKDESGAYIGTSPMFWLNYPELRDVLAQYEVVNPDNDVHRITWDDFFEQRQFSSKIIKMSNPLDENFKTDRMNDVEALYKGQAAAEKVFNKEHDMWVY